MIKNGGGGFQGTNICQQSNWKNRSFKSNQRRILLFFMTDGGCHVFAYFQDYSKGNFFAFFMSDMLSEGDADRGRDSYFSLL